MNSKLDLQYSFQKTDIFNNISAVKDTEGNIFSKGVDFFKKLWDEGDPITSNLTTASYWESYYSGSDVAILIGDIWVDDIVTIQYTLTNNKSPIYGYMSEKFDAVAKGTRIVQGQMVIAYKYRGYLQDILNRYDAQKRGTTFILNSNLLDNTASATSDKSVDRFGYIEDVPHGGYINRSGFDVYITFGDVYNVERGGTTEMINNCHITSRSVVCEPSGEPIAEVYSFFGRDLNENNPRIKYQLEIPEVIVTDPATLTGVFKDTKEADNPSLMWRKTKDDTTITEEYNTDNTIDDVVLLDKVSENYNIA